MASEPVLFVATISTLLLQTKNEAIGELADVRSQLTFLRVTVMQNASKGFLVTPMTDMGG